MYNRAGATMEMTMRMIKKTMHCNGGEGDVMRGNNFDDHVYQGGCNHGDDNEDDKKTMHCNEGGVGNSLLALKVLSKSLMAILKNN